MKKRAQLIILAALCAATSIACGQSNGQIELRYWSVIGGQGSMRSKFVSPENGKAIGIGNDGNPAMIAAGGSAALAGLSDVAVSGLADGDLFQYNLGAGKWRNVPGSIYQAANANLSALGGLTSVANKLPYFAGSGAASTTDLTAFARSLLDDSDAATMRGTLGLTIGSAVQAYNAATTILGNTTTGTGAIVRAVSPTFTGTVTASVTGNAGTATALETGRSINGVDFDGTADIVIIPDLASEVTGMLPISSGGTGAATASDARTALGLAIGSAVQPYSASTSLLGSSIDLTSEVAGTLPISSGGTGATTASDARVALGLIINANVQGYSGRLQGLTVVSGSVEGVLTLDPLTNTWTRYTTLPKSLGGTGGTAIPAEIVIACSDETTAATTGTGKVTFRMPHAMSLSTVRLDLTSAPTGSAFVVDINEAGSTVLSTKLSVDDGEDTSATATTAAFISDRNLADNAQITIDFDQIGSATAGAGIKVTLTGTR